MNVLNVIPLIFMIETEDRICHPQSELTNCFNTTKRGCELCEEGYYLDNRRCHVCPSECTKCDSLTSCSSCQEGKILYNNKCEDISIVEHCVSARNNTCSQCEDGYKLSDDGLSCIEIPKYGMIIGVSVGSISGILILILVILFIIFYVLIKIKEKKSRKFQFIQNIKIKYFFHRFNKFNCSVKEYY